MPRPGHQDRGRLLGSGPLQPACSLRGRGHLHWAGEGHPQLSRYPGSDQRRRDHQRGCDSPGLRIPERERRLRRSVRNIRHQVHWTDSGSDPHDGLQAAGPDRHGRSRRADLARIKGHPEQPRRGTGSGGADRLSGDVESGGGRRRARHAHCPIRARPAASADAGAERSSGGILLRRCLHGEAGREAAPHRVSNYRRPSRRMSKCWASASAPSSGGIRS